MTIQVYSMARDANTYVSANFQVREFASKDGSDEVLIDDALVRILQTVRDYYSVPITITSGYRSPAHNASVGGASNSQHIYGRAADIVVRNIDPLQVARYLESIGVNGIGYYPPGQGNFCHADTRQTRYFWERRNGRNITVSTFGAPDPSPTPDPDPDNEFTITVNPREIYVDGIAKTVRAGLINGENYVHLRDICNALDVNVSYDDVTRRIDLTRIIGFEEVIEPRTDTELARILRAILLLLR